LYWLKGWKTHNVTFIGLSNIYFDYWEMMPQLISGNSGCLGAKIQFYIASLAQVEELQPKVGILGDDNQF
jgi:hypothetical protein